MIEIKNLIKSYGTEKVLDNINLKIEDSTIFGLIGKSGAGKSTILNCLVGWENYQSGSIVVDGVVVENLDKDSVRKFRKNIGMIFQNFCLLNRKTVYENIAFPMKCWNFSKEEIDGRVKELSEIVGLTDKLYRKPSELSGGQKQRVAIARALTMKPKYLLCDEATSSLDPKTTNSILSLLKNIKETMGITIIIITHEMEVVEKVCDYVGILDEGKISVSGTVKEIFLDKSEALNKFTGKEISNRLSEEINISFIVNKNDESSSILWELGSLLSTPYKILDSKKYNFAEGEYLNFLMGVDKGDLDKCVDFLKSKNIDYKIQEGEK